YQCLILLSLERCAFLGKRSWRRRIKGWLYGVPSPQQGRRVGKHMPTLFLRALEESAVVYPPSVRDAVAGMTGWTLDNHRFLSTHQSQFDILALLAVLDPFQLRWVAKRELRKVPILGLCAQLTHQILVDRESRTQAVAVIRQVKRLLDAGISVLFFPEGTRSKDGQLLPFKPGGFAVAVETGVPVVPVTINGSRRILPSGDWKVRAGELEIVLGVAIQLDPR